MKKVIIVSDTHGNKKAIDNIFEKYQFDYLLFLGDTISDLGIYINDERVKAVRGNCDFFSGEKHDRVVGVEGLTIFMTHGDKYGVKSTLNYLYKQVEELNPDIVLFGHTHKYYNEKLGDIQFLNPGALSSVRGGLNTFMVLSIDNKKFSIEKCTF